MGRGRKVGLSGRGKDREWEELGNWGERFKIRNVVIRVYFLGVDFDFVFSFLGDVG